MRYTIEVGDIVESVFGSEHRGEVVEIKAFKDGVPFYFVKRHSDGFVWYGWPATVIKVQDKKEETDG